MKFHSVYTLMNSFETKIHVILFRASAGAVSRTGLISVGAQAGD